MPVADTLELGQMQAAYKAAVEEWIAAIKQEEALKSVNSAQSYLQASVLNACSQSGSLANFGYVLVCRATCTQNPSVGGMNQRVRGFFSRIAHELANDTA